MRASRTRILLPLLLLCALLHLSPTSIPAPHLTRFNLGWVRWGAAALSSIEIAVAQQDLVQEDLQDVDLYTAHRGGGGGGGGAGVVTRWMTQDGQAAGQEQLPRHATPQRYAAAHGPVYPQAPQV